MTRRNVWVTRRDDGQWQVIRESTERATSVHDTRWEADARAREIATRDGAERITQGRDGKIRSKDSYGNESNRLDTER